MALTRTPSRVRSLIAGAALIAVVGAVILPRIAGADPGQPTIGEVTLKLDKLSHQVEVLAEKYNQAAAEVKSEQKQADQAQRDALAAAASYQKARQRLSQTVIATYESSQFSRAGALLTSENGQSYLETLNTLSLISSHRADVLAAIIAAHTKAVAAQKTADRLLAVAKSKRDALDKQRKAVATQQQKFQDLLQTLTDQQQATYQNSNSVNPATTPVVPAKAPSGAIQKVVDFAVAQVGKPYVFAAAGPGAFDCSGLTMAAYEQVGIQLPHLAADQYNYGTHVSASQLQPGDLIFLYQPITHVEIYIGNDLAVSAADEALGIRYVHPSQDMGDWAGATRLIN